MYFCAAVYIPAISISSPEPEHRALNFLPRASTLITLAARISAKSQNGSAQVLLRHSRCMHRCFLISKWGAAVALIPTWVKASNNAVVVFLNASPTSGADLAIITSGVVGSGYSEVIMNLGPEAATDASLKDTLPNGVDFVSATTTQGSCTHSSGIVTCAIGSLAAGYDVAVKISVTVGTNAHDGTVTNTTNVTAAEPDLVPSNNTATQNSEVFTLTVQSAGTGSGTITSTPSGINCGAVCSQHYMSGSSVSLAPTAAAGSSFSGWGSSCNPDASGSCSFAMMSDVSVTATFDKAATPPPSSDGGGGGGAFSFWELYGILLLGLWRRLYGTQPIPEVNRGV